MFKSLISVFVETTQLLLFTHHFRVKHRGVGKITGSVIMLGTVGTIAAIVLTFGLGSIYDLNTFLIDVDATEDTLKENLIIAFVEFDVTPSNSSSDVIITVRNTGLNDITIDSISIVDIDTQTFIALQTDTAKVIPPKTKDKVTVTTTCPNFVVDDACMSANYKIILSTVRGNVYEIEAVPLRA